MIALLKSPVKSLRAYYALSRDRKGILRSKDFKGKRTPRKWLKFLGPIAHFMRQAALARIFYRAGMFFCLGLGVLALVLAVFLGGVWVLPVGLSFLCSLIFFLLQFAMRALLDFSANFDRMALPLLEFLQEKNPGKKLFLMLDFRGKTIDEKEASNRKTGVTNYRDRWFAGEMLLPDGTRMKWEVLDKIKETKKGSRKNQPIVKCRVKRFINVKRFVGGKVRRKQHAMKFQYFMNDLNARDENLDRVVPLRDFLTLFSKIYRPFKAGGGQSSLDA